MVMGELHDISGRIRQAVESWQATVFLLHRIPLRDRLRVPEIRHDAELAEVLAVALRQHAGVNRVRVNRPAGSLVVNYSDPTAQASLGEWLAQLPEIEVSFEAAAAAESGSREQKSRHAQKNAPRRRAARKPSPLQDSEGEWHLLELSAVLQSLQADAEGLEPAEALRRLERDGVNALSRMQRRSDLRILAEQFQSAPVAMLGVSAAIALLTAAPVDAAVIAVVVGANAGIGFLTERQAEKTIASLASTEDQRARVLRDGKVVSIAAEDVVRGDVLLLEPGTQIPADARLIRARHLQVDESVLTGESMPVKKKAEDSSERRALADRRNLVHLGTTVSGGSGTAIVTETGNSTELGRIQALASGAAQPMTPMQENLARISTQLALLSSAICGLVFVAGVMRGQPSLAMLNTAISLAVAAVPEGLPAISNTLLAIGIRRMRDKQVLARKLDAIENLGAIDVLCIDKTGTLTENRMRVVEVVAPGEPLEKEESRVAWTERTDALDKRFWQVLALCNESRPEEGGFSGSPTENALLEAAIQAGIDVIALRTTMTCLRVSHRSVRRPYMSTQHRYPRKKGCFVAVKGRPKAVLARCSHVRRNGRRVRLTDRLREQIIVQNGALMAESYRVLGVAWKHHPTDEQAKSRELEWLGLVAMADPLRPEVKELLPRLREAGIRPIILTGDQRGTAAAIGRELDLNGGDEVRVLGADELEDLSGEELLEAVELTQVFARVSPAMKLKLVQALQAAGHNVGMTGDGINDGPALKVADVGIAMGRDGTEVARSMSDVVLTDDRLQSILDAIAYGRGSYANMEKAIEYLLSTNLGEVQVTLAAIVAGLPAPLSPIQLLWINLVTDVFPALAIGFEEPEWDVLKQSPVDANEGVLSRDRLLDLARQSLPITGATVIAYLYALQRYGPGVRARTQAFMTLTQAQLLQALSSRTRNSSIFSNQRTLANRWLKLSVGASVAAQFGTMLPGIRRLLDVSRLGFVDLLVVTAGATVPLLINEWVKEKRLEQRQEKCDEVR